MWARDDAAKKVSAKYEIANWVSINQFVTLDWDTWLNLNDIQRRALALEVEELARNATDSKREQEVKLEKMLSKENTGIQFPSSNFSPIGRF